MRSSVFKSHYHEEFGVLKRCKGACGPVFVISLPLAAGPRPKRRPKRKAKR